MCFIAGLLWSVLERFNCSVRIRQPEQSLTGQNWVLLSHQLRPENPWNSGLTAGPAAGLAGHGFIDLFVFLSVWVHSKQAAGEGQSEERECR